MKNQLTEAYNLLIDKLEGWFNIIVTNIPNLILAVLVLITAYFVSKYEQICKQINGK